MISDGFEPSCCRYVNILGELGPHGIQSSFSTSLWTSILHAFPFSFSCAQLWLPLLFCNMFLCMYTMLLCVFLNLASSVAVWYGRYITWRCELGLAILLVMIASSFDVYSFLLSAFRNSVHVLEQFSDCTIHDVWSLYVMIKLTELYRTCLLLTDLKTWTYSQHICWQLAHSVQHNKVFLWHLLFILYYWLFSLWVLKSR